MSGSDAVPPTRVLLLGLRPFLADLVRGLVVDQPDIQIAPETIAPDALLSMDTEVMPHVVIVEVDGDGIPAVCGPLLLARPAIRVLALTADGHDTACYESRPYRRWLGNVSPRGLLNEIRAVADRDRP
jgi:hypothetical protein